MEYANKRKIPAISMVYEYNKLEKNILTKWTRYEDTYDHQKCHSIRTNSKTITIKGVTTQCY